MPDYINPMALSVEIRSLLQKEMGDMGVLTLKKQCLDMGINPDNIKIGDIPRLARALARALAPMVGQDRAKAMERQILRYKFLAELGELQKTTDPNVRARREALLFLNLAGVSKVLKEWDEAKKQYKKAAEAARKTNQPVLEAEAYRGLGHIAREQHLWEEAERWFKKAQSISASVGDNVGLADASRGLGLVGWYTGRFEEAKKLLKEAVEIARKIKDKSLLGTALIDLGNVYNEKGNLDRAFELYREASEILKETDNHEELARAYNNMGDVMLQKKEWKQAIEYFQECKKEAEKILSDMMTSWATFNMAEAYLNLGEVDKCIELTQKAIATLKLIEDVRGLSAAYKLLGDAFVARKKWKEAQEALEEAMKYAKETRSPHYEARTLISMANMELKRGRKKEAARYVEELKKVLKGVDAKELVAQAEELEEKL